MDFLDLDTSLKVTKQNSVLYANWLVNHATDLVELSQNNRSAYIKENIGFVESNPGAIISFLKKSGLVDSQLRTSLLSYMISNGTLSYNEYCFIHLSKESLFLNNASVVNILALICKFIIEKDLNIININQIRELGLDLQVVPNNVNGNKRTDYLSAVLEGTGLFSFVGKKEEGIMELKNEALPIISFLNSCNLKNCDYDLNSEKRFDYFSSCYGGIFDYLKMELPEIWGVYFPHLNSSLTLDESIAFKERSTKWAALPLQQIFYGAPGTGKSHGTDGEIKKIYTTKNDERGYVFRTTFHPDSDYSTFVGCYKPIMGKPQPIYGFDSVGKTVKVEDPVGTIVEKHEITYNFVAQSFTKAYIAAWKALLKNEKLTGKDGKEFIKPIFLVIEEINRGNCAQIFGDLFQLLDREDGFSTYPIKPDTDLGTYIQDEFAEEGLSSAVYDSVIKGEELILPCNLYIWATMNTSDQSLFPIDSAFKRRWDWKYVPIKDVKENWKLDVEDKDGNKVDWYEFIKQMNKIIYKMTTSADKQMGYFFCKADKKADDAEADADNTIISMNTFVNKVVFYLWNDVFKDYGMDEGDLFKYKKDGKDEDLVFTEFFDEDGEPNADAAKAFIGNVMKWGKDDKAE